MKLFNDDIRKQLTEVFETMKTPVTLALFTNEGECATCTETQDLMEEVQELSEKISYKKFDMDNDKNLAEKYGVDMTPSIVLLDSNEEYKGVKFYGIPAGHEINSFITGILEVSGSGSELPDEITERLSKVDKPVDIKVFVTLGCPHCPGAVQKAHKLALSNPNIQAHMIEAQTFGDLSDEFNVSSVPKIVINNEFEFVGNQPLEVFLQTIEDSLK